MGAYQVTGKSSNGVCSVRTLLDGTEIGGARASIYITGTATFTGTGMGIAELETKAVHTLDFEGYGTVSWADGYNITVNFIRIGEYVAS